MSDASASAEGQDRMIDVARSTTVSVAPDAVWQAIGDFCGIADWHPAVTACSLSKPGSASVRTLTLAGGATLSEELVHWDDAAMSYTYKIVEGPLPVENYTSTIAVSDGGDGSARIDWSGRFEASGASVDEASGVIAGIYESGLAALVAKVEG
ncbi:hypothetical protein ASG43_05520 [Aureimonas sp. Leaf454]|uniref:SRPBCC family protein n=1 Tax=Aureimonas sp. Leaf454 TaxID=1736381 RepID=UPI0006F2E2EF|nr:SRPBCC family protein [Aureimonas sp. Leaf454]KQT50738.1 hypothetical protein ASG43_05520 [Aureimonas sp. Leaf454]